MILIGEWNESSESYRYRAWTDFHTMQSGMDRNYGLFLVLSGEWENPGQNSIPFFLSYDFSQL